MDIDVASLFKQGGVALVTLVMLAYVIKRIGERMIASIDRVTERHDENARAVVNALGGLTERVARVEGRIEGIAGREDFEDEQTPVEVPYAHKKSATPAQGNPSLPYGLKPNRPKTNG